MIGIMWLVISENDLVLEPLDLSFGRQIRKCPIKCFVSKPQLRGEVLERSAHQHGASVRAGVESEEMAHPISGGANIAPFKLRPQVHDFSR